MQQLELGKNKLKRLPKASAAGGAPGEESSSEVLPGERELGAAFTVANELTGAFTDAVKTGEAELPSTATEVPSPPPPPPHPETGAASPAASDVGAGAGAASPAASDVGEGADAASPAASDVDAGVGAASPAASEGGQAASNGEAVSTDQAASTGGEAATDNDYGITYGDAKSGKVLTSAQALPPGVEWWENGGPQHAAVLTPTTMVDNAPLGQQVQEEKQDKTMGVPLIFNQDRNDMPDTTINDIAQVLDHPSLESMCLSLAAYCF